MYMLMRTYFGGAEAGYWLGAVSWEASGKVVGNEQGAGELVDWIRLDDRWRLMC